MIIKFSKDYCWVKTTYDSDAKMLREYESVTCPTEYSATWEEADVTLEQLQEYANKGYAIKINC
jgi:hypothetical protein